MRAGAGPRPGASLVDRRLAIVHSPLDRPFSAECQFVRRPAERYSHASPWIWQSMLVRVPATVRFSKSIKARRSGPLLTLQRFRLRNPPQMQRLSTLMWQPLDLGRPEGAASRFTATSGSISLLPLPASARNRRRSPWPSRCACRLHPWRSQSRRGRHCATAGSCGARRS